MSDDDLHNRLWLHSVNRRELRRMFAGDSAELLVYLIVMIYGSFAWWVLFSLGLAGTLISLLSLRTDFQCLTINREWGKIVLDQRRRRLAYHTRNGRRPP